MNETLLTLSLMFIMGGLGLTLGAIIGFALTRPRVAG